MDYSKQAEDMIKMWTDAQKRAWDTMLAASRGFGGSPSTDMWEKSMEALEDSFKKSFEAQAKWTEMWADQLKSANVPEAMRDWAKQAQEMMKNLAEAQARQWSEWFRVVRKLNPAKAGGGWESDVASFMNTWKDMADKALATQREWAGRWLASAQQSKATKKAEGS